jgi:single-stranded-DNA-specific exonuclease
LFDGEFEIISRRVVGAKHLKLMLRPATGGRPVDAIAFGAAPEGSAPGWPRVRTAYRLDVNEYQGNRSLQLVIEYLAPV